MGVFDGVHLGHRSLLERAAAAAREASAPLWVLTFWPHPDVVLGRRDGSRGYLLTTLDDKAGLLGSAGVERLLVMRFTREAASSSPEEFVSELISGLEPRAVVVGFNFTFGRDGRGGPAALGHLGRAGGVEVMVHPAVRIGEEVVSSSAVRAALAAGDMKRAGLLLGRPYSLSGTVERGAGRGAGLGFPTANVGLLGETVTPAPGVYICSVLRGEVGAGLPAAGAEPAVANLGTCPTFSEGEGGGNAGLVPRLEAHILEGEPPTYGDRVRVFFHRRLRAEMKFEGPERLAAQIALDREREIGRAHV